MDKALEDLKGMTDPGKTGMPAMPGRSNAMFHWRNL